MSEPDPPVSASPSFAGLAADAADLARAACNLVESELALTRRSLRRVVAGALVLPILAAGLWLGANGLLVALLHTFGCGWSVAFAIDVGFQFGVLFALLWALRHWLHEMSFPNSRRALDRIRREFS